MNTTYRAPKIDLVSCNLSNTGMKVTINVEKSRHKRGEKGHRRKKGSFAKITSQDDAISRSNSSNEWPVQAFLKDNIPNRQKLCIKRVRRIYGVGKEQQDFHLFFFFLQVDAIKGHDEEVKKWINTPGNHKKALILIGIRMAGRIGLKTQRV